MPSLHPIHFAYGHKILIKFVTCRGFITTKTFYVQKIATLPPSVMSNRPENTIQYLWEITSLRRPPSWSPDYSSTPSVQRILCRMIKITQNDVQGVWLKTGVLCFKKCFSMCLEGLKKSTESIHWRRLPVMWSRIEPVIFGMRSAYTSSVIK